MIENEEIKKEQKRGVMKKKRKLKSINRIKRYIYCKWANMGRKEDSRKNNKMKERRGRKTKDSKNRISKGDGWWEMKKMGGEWTRRIKNRKR